MAVATAITVAEVAAEALAEAAAETIAETTAEAVAETAAETVAETAAETVAETAAETVAETAAETAAEAAAESAAETAAESAAEESAMSSGILSKVVKIGALVTIGLGVASIIDLIKAKTGAGIKKCPLDPATKQNLDGTQDAMQGMTAIMGKWNAVLGGLSKDTDFGNVDVKVKGEKESVHVSSLFCGIMNNITKDLTAASTIASECSENCKWKANLDVFTLHIVNALTGMMALCDLRAKSKGLQRYNIPAKKDKNTLQDILEKDFPKWKEYIVAQAKKHLNQALVKQVAANATKDVLPIVKQPIKEGVLTQAKAQVLPSIINNAKSSGKNAANKVFNDRRAHIIEIGLIPFYGWVKAPMLIADAKRDAINDAKNAAKASVNTAFNSPAIKGHMDHIATKVSQSVFAQHKAQIDKTIKKAVDDTIKHYKPLTHGY